MTDKRYLIYKHVSPSGKIYIGQTCQIPERRWMNGLGYKAHPYFFNAIRKYGWDNFEHVIIADDLTKKEADWLEKYLIAYYETMNPLKGYNLTKGGEGSLGRVASEETRRKISEANKGKHTHQLGKKHSDEAKQKMSIAQRGKVISEDTRKKMSEAKENYVPWNKGLKGVQVAWNKGKSPSNETKQKQREAAKLRWERIRQQKSA